MTLLNTSLSQMLQNTIFNLAETREILNHINVFPVPDGDTGTNMYLTVNNCTQLINESTDTPTPSFSDIANSILLNSKGNSGVILSSFIHGCLSELEQAVQDTPELWLLGFKRGRDKAHASIGNPEEGTMLSVMDGISDYKNYNNLDTIELSAFWEQVTQVAWAETKKTANGLPALKAADVIDSGAAGLTILLYSFASTYNPASHAEMTQQFIPWLQNFGNRFNRSNLDEYLKTTDFDEWGSCCQLLIKRANTGTPHSIKQILSTFESITSVVLSETEEMVKLHLHTHEPEPVFRSLGRYFEIIESTVEDMDLQVSGSHGTSIVVVTDDLTEDLIFKNAGLETLIQDSNNIDHFLRQLEFLSAKPESAILVSTSPRSAEVLELLPSTWDSSKIVARNLPESLTVTTIFEPSQTVATNIEEITSVLNGLTTITLNQPSSNLPLPTFIGTEISRVKTSNQSLITIYLNATLFDRNLAELESNLITEFPGAEIQIYESQIPGPKSFITLE